MKQDKTLNVLHPSDIAELQRNSFKLDATVHQWYISQRLPDGVIERLQIVKALGKGASGQVWKLQEETGARRTRALKFVRESGDLEIKEVENLISLNQYERHFTRFFGWWTEEDGSLFLVTELMEGGDLRKLIGEGPTYVTEDRAKRIAKKILEATAIMHSRGIIHRDLKPSNILLADTNHELLDIRIADLGIAKTISVAKAEREKAGTSGYMAPEVVYTTSSGYDLKADIWSLGCVIFATLTGRSPYNSDKLPKPYGNDGAFPSDLLEYHEVSELGIEFIKSLVRVDSKARPTAQSALGHRWLLGV